MWALTFDLKQLTGTAWVEISFSAGYSSGALQSWRPQAASLWSRFGWRHIFVHILHQHSSRASWPHRYSPAVSDIRRDAGSPSQCHYHPRLATIQDFAQQHGDPSEEGHRLDGRWSVHANCGQPLHLPFQGPHWRRLVTFPFYYCWTDVVISTCNCLWGSI